MAVTVFFAVVATCICIMIHHQALLAMTHLTSMAANWRRGGVVIGVLGGLVAHVVEIAVYAIAYGLLVSAGRYGSLGTDMKCGDYAYYSFVTFTTLGFGDITPSGPIRFLTCTEALTGAVLITWTASFLFLQMQRHWERTRGEQ